MAKIKSTKATLGGFPLLASTPARWVLREGVFPHIETFELRPGDAARLLATRKTPVDLVFAAKGKLVTIKNLYVLGNTGQDQPQIAKVVVADRRWVWGFRRVKRDFNIRRNIGNKYVNSPYSDARLVPVVPSIAYWPWSKNGEIPWQARDVLANVMAEICSKEQEWNGRPCPFTDNTGASLNQLPIENLSVNDQAPNALMRVLNYMPAVGIRCDADGVVRTFLKTAGGEDEMFGRLGPEIDGGGHPVVAIDSMLRGARVIVHLQYEVETRFDFAETGESGTVAQSGQDARYMDNVGPVTDSTIVTGYAEGTYLTLPQHFTAWGSRNGFGSTPAEWFRFVRRAFVPWFDLWADLGLTGEFSPDGNWAGRIAMLQRCYRQVFRLNSRWTDRMRSIRAYRVSTVEQATGTRAPAVAFADHCLIPSMRGKIGGVWTGTSRQGGGTDAQNFCINVAAYANNNPAPCDVQVIDADQGIIGFAYKIDNLRSIEKILPSQIQNGPTGDIRNPRVRPVSFDSVARGQEPPMLTAGFLCSVILTCVPGAPNSGSQFHKVVVSPTDVQSLVAGDIGECIGPDYEIYIGPNIATAKVLWTDGRASDIEKIFGVTPGVPNLQGILLNDGPSSPTTGASITNVAYAAAASYYAALIDRIKGSQSGLINPNVGVIGYIDSVTHEIGTKGRATTRVAMPEKLPALDIRAYMDSNTRAAVDQLAQPQGVS